MSISKNWMKQVIYILIFSVLIASCDSFQEDVVPAGDEVLVLREAMRTVPNTPLYLDLKRDIRSSGVVRFSIDKHPEKGTASISSNAILEYFPHESFTSGRDFFALSLEDASGMTLDIDSLYISMGDNLEGTIDQAWGSCEGMALSDFYQTLINQQLTVSPLINDGFCDSSYQAIQMSIIEEPKHGELNPVYSQFQNYTYTYQPDLDFIGEDEFMYDISFVDSLGNEQYSLAKVFITVTDDDFQVCDSVVYPFFYVLTDSVDFVDFMPFNHVPECPISEWIVEIEAVANGNVEVLQSGIIRYYPGYSEIDSINYLVTFFDITYHNSITIYRDYYIADSTFCTDAEDDWFYLYIMDSIGRSNEPYVLDILGNDYICSEDDLGVILLTEPDIGEAFLDAENQLVYYTDQEFAGVREFKMLYEICGPDLCDSAFVHLTVEQ